ncbi:uncharacterized protein Tco025E_00937 [Trypanosoma conorhini]|uniref:Uncharacterized protein n=1 Tax=Trypanosoma conorhini TaxID=83891 RepID=A0A422QA83_9TRYP|nr:uncharacterized protein Tco025E_00937 [Trypanosoma conorhini]RNF26855.1 hypothetical protein Tco025E_00937 [Trypanosoma conorhini]
MAATQAIELLRVTIDTVLAGPQGDERGVFRWVVLGLAGFIMVVSWCLLRRVYKSFGWTIFRRGGAKRSVREMFRMHQRHRACNLLDAQCACLLFAALVFFLSRVSTRAAPGC